VNHVIGITTTQIIGKYLEYLAVGTLSIIFLYRRWGRRW